MDNFWQGFEKAASLASSLGKGLGFLRSSPSRLGGAAGAAKQEYLKAYVGAARKRMPHGALGRGTASAAKPVEQVVETAAKAPKAKPIGESVMSSLRGRGKALITGGLLGAGGTYMASGDQGQYQQPY